MVFPGWRCQILLHAGILQRHARAPLPQSGRRRFEDVAEKAGIGDATSKSLGVTVLDYNSDGWPDLFVSNDTQPNKLYRNNRNGTFTEEGMTAGVAYGEDGVARGAMGTDWADYDRSGKPHLLVGNFSNQMLGLYHNEGNGLFVDEAPSSSVGRASLLSSLSASSFSTTIWTATRTFLLPTAMSRKRSATSSRR
jgi:hypothetical protein